jgi:hypothetical protein
MSVSFRFEDNDRGYKEHVRSADSNRGWQERNGENGDG